MNKGIESLKAAVLRDTENADNCFSPTGCIKSRTEIVPQDNPRLIAMGIETMCIRRSKCTHDYCGKYKWVIDRAQMYADVLECTLEEVITAWEEQRSYWYMNFYQECNQPEIKTGGIKVIKLDDWLKEAEANFGKDKLQWKFKCPHCGNVQSGQDFEDIGVKEWNGIVQFNCIGRYVKGKGCNWSLGGLFQIHRTVVVKEFKLHPVFEMALPQ